MYLWLIQSADKVTWAVGRCGEQLSHLGGSQFVLMFNKKTNLTQLQVMIELLTPNASSTLSFRVGKWP